MNNLPAGFQIVEKFAPLFSNAPYIWIKGGRAGMKSHTVAECLLIRGRSEKKRIMCAREIQKSIDESVHQLLRDKIEKLKYQSFYQIGNTKIIGQNGSQFLFAGLKTNFASVKSKEGLDIVWVEEAAKVSKESWRTLLPTIRKEGSQLIATWNPEDETDPIEGLVNLPGSIVIEVGWQDNPWASQRTLAEIRYDYKTDAETAAHVWGGGYRKKSKAQIFAGKYNVERLAEFWTELGDRNPMIQAAWFGPFYGSDWGFAQDPATLMKLWLHRTQRRIYIQKEAYGVGVQLNELPQLWRATIPECQMQPSKVQEAQGITVFDIPQPVIRADNSRPETIEHMRNFGFNVIAAEKWAGSVEDGVEWLRTHQITIDPSCTHQEQEAKSYKYKEDPITGDVLPIIIDKWNHCWDGDRYALQPAIKPPEQEVVVVAEDPTVIGADIDQFDQGSLEEMASW